MLLPTHCTAILRYGTLAALAVAWGFFLRNGIAAALAFIVLGILSGVVLRSWWVVPILAVGMLLGTTGRIVADAGWPTFGPPYNEATIRSLGKGIVGLSMGFTPLTVMVCIPVAAGRWVGDWAERKFVR